MRRVFLILCIFMFIPTCNAVPIGIWTDEISADPNVEVANQEQRYSWYKENIISSDDYYLRGQNDPIYPIINEDVFTWTDWSEWGDAVPENSVDRIIESESASRYRTIRPIRYLFLNNFYNRSGEFRISKINILIDNNPIATDMVCTNCSTGFTDKLYNGTSSDSTYIVNAGSLRIDLGNYYSIGRITVEVYLYSYVLGNESFDIYYNEDSRIDYRNYAYRKQEYNVISSDPLKPNKLIIIPNKSYIIHPSYSDWIYIDGAIESTFYREVIPTTRYRYKDKLYQYYRIDREYLDGYLNMPDDSVYIKDESSMKNYYIYGEKYSEDNNQVNGIEIPQELSKSSVDIADSNVVNSVANPYSIPAARAINSKKVFESNKVSEAPLSNAVAVINKQSDIKPYKKTGESSINKNSTGESSNSLLILIFVFLSVFLAFFMKGRWHILSHQK